MTPIRRALGVLAIAAVLLGAGQAAIAPAAATTLTIAPKSGPDSEASCYPFGMGGGAPVWTPFSGFVYKNIPAFQLKTGDVLAFDLSAMNPQADIQLEIAMAPTAANGGDVPAKAFTTIATNNQTPANPRGDASFGNFELQFKAQAPFSFPGGGLIIRFSNPSASYAADTVCTGVLTNSAGASDASGYFVERFYSDPDGAAPWMNIVTGGGIAAFRLTLADTGQRAAALKKCKKKHSHKKRKKCKKKANLLPV